jgi:hypothetical protein
MLCAFCDLKRGVGASVGGKSTLCPELSCRVWGVGIGFMPTLQRVQASDQASGEKKIFVSSGVAH